MGPGSWEGGLPSGTQTRSADCLPSPRLPGVKGKKWPLTCLPEDLQGDGAHLSRCRRTLGASSLPPATGTPVLGNRPQSVEGSQLAPTASSRAERPLWPTPSPWVPDMNYLAKPA